MLKKKIFLLVFMFLFSSFAVSAVSKSDLSSPQIDVHGTEYTYGDVAKPFVQLLDDNGQPLNNQSCKVSILYPNSSLFVDAQNMTFAGNGLGIYTYNVVAPNISGVFPVVVNCDIFVNEFNIFAEDFGIGVGTLKEGSILNTFVSDDIYHEIEESGGILEIFYNFSGVNVPEGTGVSLIFEGFLHYDGVFDISLLNNLTQQWDKLGDSHLATANDITFSNGFDLATYSNNGNVAVRINASDGINLQNIEIDFLAINYSTVGYQYLNSVGGSSELHITEPLSLINGLLVLVNSIWSKILEVAGIVEENQAKINQTLDLLNGTNNQLINISSKLDNLSVDVGNINVSIGDVNVTVDINATDLATKQDINSLNGSLENVRANITGEIKSLREELLDIPILQSIG